jgi:hypothetical protein
MRHCEFIDEQETWRCKHCGLATPKRSDKPPISECSGDSPVEVIRQEQQPREIESDYADCIHRGEQTRVVACGLCGDQDRPVNVYRCALLGECTLRATRPKGGAKRIQRCNSSCKQYQSSDVAMDQWGEKVAKQISG